MVFSLKVVTEVFWKWTACDQETFFPTYTFLQISFQHYHLLIRSP